MRSSIMGFKNFKMSGRSFTKIKNSKGLHIKLYGTSQVMSKAVTKIFIIVCNVLFSIFKVTLKPTLRVSFYSVLF